MEVFLKSPVYIFTHKRVSVQTDYNLAVTWSKSSTAIGFELTIHVQWHFRFIRVESC
jgi:hypothetical protein